MLTAIETKYHGCVFRSRLEARWAVFFTSLELKWSYEPEGFVLSSGERYLPDFRVELRDRLLWCEVKSPHGDATKFVQFMGDMTVDRSDAIGLILRDLPDPEIVRKIDPASWKEDGTVYFPGGGEDMSHYFCACRHCGAVSVQFMGRIKLIDCCSASKEESAKVRRETGYWDGKFSGGAGNHRIVRAICDARSFRFDSYDGV